jgi:phenylpropionate dioxygenase-like ring-hydroxylating dioxygenase large terminal subunit
VHSQADIMALAKRMLAHLDARTTDMAPDIYRNPVTRYTDESRWDAEVSKIFKGVPLVLAMTAEMRAAGQYKALNVAEVPVLLVRQNDGSVRGFLNVCRHRGAPVVDEGSGSVRRFTCRYHAWSYARSGELVGVTAAHTFGDVDRSCLGLVEIPVAERAGLIFGIPRAGTKLDIDEWLGDFAAELENLELDRRHVFSQRELGAANWKLTYDGYLEGYHFASLHPRTIYKLDFSNLMLIDSYGPHQRVVFCRKTMPEMRALPESQWRPREELGIIDAIFPHAAVSATYGGEYALVSLLFPGPTVGTSRTVQTLLTLNPAGEGSAQAEEAQRLSDFFYDAVRDEDYVMNGAVQRTLRSGANPEVIFGRNEMALQHFHTWVDRLVEAEIDARPAAST